MAQQSAQPEIRNPYDTPDYNNSFAPRETDGFPEWSTHPGFTLFNLDFPSLALVIVAIPVLFILFRFHPFAALLFLLVVAGALHTHHSFKTLHGPGYINRLLWRRGIPPLNRIVLFSYVRPGTYKRLNPLYRHLMPDPPGTDLQ